MKKKQLEERLRGLESPAPSAGLARRLDASIPGSFSGTGERRSAWRPGVVVRVAVPVAAAAAIVIAVLVATIPATPPAYAEVLAVIERASGLARGVHLTMWSLSEPGEDFSFVNLGGKPQEVEVWIQAPRGEGDRGKQRTEKADRIYVFDGRETIFYHPRTVEAYRQDGGWVDLRTYWPSRWVRELREAPPGDFEVVALEEENGAGRLVIRQEAPEMNGREPAVFEDFDRETEITWDTRSGRLTGLRRYVFHEGERTPVSEVIRIEYLQEIDGSVFRLELPENVRWGGVVEVAPEIAALGPRQVAERFWRAAIDGDWATLEMFCPSPSMIDWLKDNRPTELISLGEPFRSGSYPGMFVPYEVRFGLGWTSKVKAYNLALKQTGPQKRWVFDGGI